ncbi:acetate uptake transporter [Asticcacaulis sp. EMRT-3]|uniref:acetate uptake transporter n=1 Tax=Asticcacaulis sp. EMRT-3 TaxID=3040349 RepID=UPI0024AF11CB|nr:acetate uptake transporter [Asticcacaulis sp. EMRT-3]MDI7775444.1 acetate uptake transporter [Asticcacaulis sp. EMRT-3]
MANDATPAPITLGNPAVVGLAGFGMTTLALQLHNLGLIGIAPVLWLGFIFGGLAQFIAGFMEQKTGNNFGFCAFVGYGSFWIWLCAYIIGNATGIEIFKLADSDLGYILMGWAIFTGGLWIASWHISKAMWLTFLTLTIGFVGLAFVNWGHPEWLKPAAYTLILCAATAWYMMFSIIFKSVFGRDVLPMGKPIF